MAATSVPPTSAPTPRPALSIEQTSAQEFAITDFESVHAPVDGDPNKYLIFGNLPVKQPAPDLPPELAVFLGRWEGYGDVPSVKKDQKVVTVIQDITVQDGQGFGWGGTNLQYPTFIQKLHFRVVPGATPTIEWRYDSPDYGPQITTFTYDRDQDVLRGWAKLLAHNYTVGPFVLSRDRSFYVYKDYAQYLAGRHIYAKSYQDPALQGYGRGYLLYLPQGYEDHPEQSWPLIFFLHGSGDRGDNVYLLAKASPFMMIRETGPLPSIIAAPLLSASPGYTSFPETYLEGALAEIQASYHVDARRIYVTGLSLGGEATYRLAVHQPEKFAAIAPLSTTVDAATLAMIGRIKDLPVRVIHGANDTTFPLAQARRAVDALQQGGGRVEFTVLAGHDHDTWTDTYSDPTFYAWLLQHRRP